MFNKETKSSRSVVPRVKCAICGMMSDKATSFFCDSGHAVCKECQISECAPIKKNAGGDSNIGTKVLNLKAEYQKSNTNDQTFGNKNHLASGDHEVVIMARKKHKQSSRSKISSKKDSFAYLGTVCENNIPMSTVPTTITYKNKNYCESKSNGSNSIKTLSSGKVSTSKNCSNVTSISDIKTCPRPVICPEYKCAKMIAMDSTMMHFKFDHSKLPRIMLTCNSPQQFLLDSTKLTRSTRCLALMSIEMDKEIISPVLVSKPASEDSYNEVPLLLMGVRTPLEDLMVRYNKTQVLHECCTQTEFRYKDSFLKELKPNLKDNDSDDHLLNKEFNRTENLLLWVCKADEVASNYSITLLSGDKKHGHSYIGETISIRQPQDPVSMYHRAECFTLRGVAANRLLDDKHRILVLIAIL